MRSIYTLLLLFVYVSLTVTAGLKHKGIDNAPLGAPSQAQWETLSQLRTHTHDVVVAWNELNATPAFLSRTLTSSNYINNFPSPELAALQFIDDYKVLFKLASPTKELTLLTSETDALGMTHVKFNQSYQGILVRGSQLIVHFAKDGSISSINGRFIPTPQISISPSISKAQAMHIASSACGNIPSASAELIIYLQDNRPVFAYDATVPTIMAPMQHVIVSATNGVVLEIDSGIRYDGPTTGTGISLKSTVRPLNLYQATNNFGVSGTQVFLIDASKAMYVGPVDSLKGVIDTYDAKNDTSNPSNGYVNATLVYDPNADGNFNDNLSLRAAVDAHYFAGVVYDYYKNRFNRNSWNNSGGSLISVVHFKYNFNNAFWNGQFMTYGDGDGVAFSSIPAALDVAAHEMTHGVTGASASLEYRGQSGALNESYSDVIATMLDSTNWLIGEDVYTPGIVGDALRNMADPHNGKSFGDPAWQPARMSEYLYIPYTSEYDNGGVHINSGIPNRACYLVASQIGRGKTEQVYYRTLTNYLTSQSLFIDARNATLQSAADLYGAGGAEYNSVAAAFDSVGITSSLSRTDELSYDDGSPATYVYEQVADWGIANKLTAPGSGQLQTIEYYYLGEGGSGNGSFVVKIFDDNSGSPGSLLFASTPYTPPGGFAGWLNISVPPGINVSGNFYVGMFYDGVNVPLLGVDTVANGRAYEYDATNTIWTALDQFSVFPVTFFIRAIVNTVTGVRLVSNEIPNKFDLSQNYPNPFNPATDIRYDVSKAGLVTLKVYNLLGQEVAVLVNENQQPGFYQFTFDGNSLPSGVYFYRLQAGTFTETKKLLLLR